MARTSTANRKMLTDIEAPYVLEIQDLMATQSARTIATWTTRFAIDHLLPLWEARHPDDVRPRAALDAAMARLEGTATAADVKAAVAACRAAARSASDPIAQGACRAIDAASNAQANPTGALGLVFYGALSLARDQLGVDTTWEQLEEAAGQHAWQMAQALRDVWREGEEHPARLQWNC